MRIELTARAQKVVRLIREQGRDDLVMVLGNGCCDSTAPYLYDHYLPEPGARQVGEIDSVSVIAPAWLADLYPGEEMLTVDVEEGILNDSLSLESEHDCRFVLRGPEKDPKGLSPRDAPKAAAKDGMRTSPEGTGA